MSNLRDFKQPGGKPQRGAAAVEFALIAGWFFLLLLGIIEFGRFLYVWNTVQEVTRRAAREAVVSWETERDAIKTRALFGGASLPAGAEITANNINIRYLDWNKNGIAENRLPGSSQSNADRCFGASEGAPNDCIKYVEVSIISADEEEDSAKYAPMIGLFTFLNIDIPPSTVVMPAECLCHVAP